MLAILLIAGFSSLTAGVPAYSNQKISNDPYTPLLGHYEENGDFFSGDILSSPKSKAATNSPQSKWPASTLIYEYSPSIPQGDIAKIEDSLRTIERQTCIRFRQRTSETDYVQVTNMPSGCYSYLGRTGGSQQLNLGNGCLTTGTIQHEFMHALGFIHEHTRPDRNDYVLILYPNIIPIYYTQFTRQSESRINPLGPYDFGSVMHYPLTAGSITGFPTILPRRSLNGERPGQRNSVSDLDVKKLNAFYCEGQSQ